MLMLIHDNDNTKTISKKADEDLPFCQEVGWQKSKASNLQSCVNDCHKSTSV